MIEAGEILAFRWKAANGMAGGDVFAPVALEEPRPPRPEDRPRDRSRATAASSPASPPRPSPSSSRLEADRPGRFSTNAVALFPGHPAEIAFTPDAGDPAGVTLTVRDLYSSYA